MKGSAAPNSAINAPHLIAYARGSRAGSSTWSQPGRLIASGGLCNTWSRSSANCTAKGIDLYLHQQGIDTTTPAGKAMFQMMGVFAEFERAMIVERVRSGLARARAAGKRLGRPNISRRKEDVVRRLLVSGTGIVKAAKTVGVGVSVAQRIKAELNA
jgi:DNA invertase Pin-like site-specific DNA recombinase